MGVLKLDVDGGNTCVNIVQVLTSVSAIRTAAMLSFERSDEARLTCEWTLDYNAQRKRLPPIRSTRNTPDQL